MYGFARPKMQSERMALTANWAALNPPDVVSRTGRYWSDAPPVLGAEGACAIYTEIPDGMMVIPIAGGRNGAYHVSAYYDASDRSIRVHGWAEGPYTAANGQFHLIVDVFPEVS